MAIFPDEIAVLSASPRGYNLRNDSEGIHPMANSQRRHHAPGYFAVFMAATGLICGIGTTEEAAFRAAKEAERPGEDDIYYDIKPCSEALYRMVLKRGGDISYDDRHGILVTEEEARIPAVKLV